MAGDEIIYLDNNATTPLDPAVIEEMLPFLKEYYGNPSSGYAFGAKARKAIGLARERLAALLGFELSEIVFTSGGTESNNAVINCAMQSEPRAKFATGRIRHGGHIVTSAVEHSCAATLPGSREKRMQRDVSWRRSGRKYRFERIESGHSPGDRARLVDVGK